MLDGLVRLRMRFDASLQLISGMSTGDEIAGLKSAMLAPVAAVRSMIDEAVMRAVAESELVATQLGARQPDGRPPRAVAFSASSQTASR